jgi:hypothetical protein
MHRLMPTLLLLAVASASVPAAAQAPEGTSERALARSLFHQGIECLDAEDLQCAAERFTRSHELRPSAVVAYNLASVLARLGRVVHAAELLRWVRRSNANDQVKEAAAALLPQITPRIAHWVLRAEGATESVRFYLDGSQLPEQIVGVRAPVDPGDHQVEARRGGETVAETSFSVEAQGEAEAILEVPEPSVPTAEETARRGGETRVVQVVRERDPEAEARARRVRRGVGIGVAIALVAGAVVLGVLLREPDAAQPIPGNLSPAVVEIGD